MKSIKKRLFLQMGLLVLLLVSLSVMANTLFLKPYYTSKMENRMVQLYEEINRLPGDYKGSINELVVMGNNMPIDILIMSPDEDILYTSNSFYIEGQLRERFERIKAREGREFHPMLTRGQWSIGQPPIQEEGNEQGPGPARIELVRQISERIALFHAYGDPLFNNKVLVLSGFLDSGAILEIKMPVLSIDRSIMITNGFMIICGGLIFILAMGFAYILSASFTRPIMEVNEVTKALSELDFNRKCEVDSEDEIGELAKSINNLSIKLSETIKALNLKNDELETLVHDVSHELKTPLALLHGYAEGIKVNVADDRDKVDFYTEVIIDETKKMNRIVESLLDIKQLSSQETQLYKKSFVINDLIDDVLLKTEGLIKATGGQVLFHNEQEYIVKGDAFRLEQVLMNYLTNAIQYSDHKQACEIEVNKVDGACRVSFYNSCSPIADDDLNHVWDKFYKVDSSRTRSKGGHGLGLSIVKTIQEAHGQAYGVYKKNNGLVFWIDIKQ